MTRRPSRRTAVALAVRLVVALALIAAGTWWFTGRDDGTRPATVATTWSYTQAREVRATGGGFHAQAVAEGDGLLVAAGDVPASFDEGDDPDVWYDLDAWYSTDATTWTRSDLRSVSRGAGWYTEFAGLTSWNGGFLVTGKGIDTGGLPATMSAPAFFSADGRTWRLLEPPFEAGSGHPLYLTDGAHAYLSRDRRSLWRLNGKATRWTRTDARAPKGCHFRGPGAASGAGDALIVGSCDPHDSAPVALYRLTDDGERLRDLTDSLPDDLFTVEGVALRGDTLLLSTMREKEPATEGTSPSAGGGTPGGTPNGALDGPEGPLPTARPVFLRSTDGGEHWTEATLPVRKGVKPGSGSVTGLFRSGDTFVALGGAVLNELTQPAAWVSPDGERWTPVRLRPFAEEGYLGQGAALDGRVVVPALSGGGPVRTVGLLTSGRKTTAAPPGTTTPPSRTAPAPSGTGSPPTTPAAPSSAPAPPSSVPALPSAPASATAPASSPTAPASSPAGPTGWTGDVWDLTSPFSGEISGGSGPAARYEVLVTLSPGRADPPTVRDLAGRLHIKGDSGCTARLSYSGTRADGKLVFGTSERQGPLPGMVLGGFYCPDLVELRLKKPGELEWKSEGGYTGTLTAGSVD
ncbi:hypothetical protein JNUCC64_12575 [Streptomyces sp. JNUCC 64]